MALLSLLEEPLSVLCHSYIFFTRPSQMALQEKNKAFRSRINERCKEVKK